MASEIIRDAENEGLLSGQPVERVPLYDRQQSLGPIPIANVNPANIANPRVQVRSPF